MPNVRREFLRRCECHALNDANVPVHPKLNCTSHRNQTLICRNHQRLHQFYRHRCQPKYLAQQRVLRLTQNQLTSHLPAYNRALLLNAASFLTRAMRCCPAVMEPTKETAGNTLVAKTFKSTKLFVTGPAQSKAGLIAIPDIFGPDSGRIKQDAEALGKLGYAVVLVDAAGGDYPKSLEGVNVLAWLQKNSFEKVSGAHVANAIAYLQEEVGVQSICSYGYCWGAYVGAKQSSLSSPVIKGHVSFHPSWMAEQLVNGEGAVEKMAERISVPQVLCAAGNDIPLVSEGGAVEKILKSKPAIADQSSVVNFPDMIHGWVCRGDVEDPATKEAVKKAWHLASEFIQEVNPL